MATIDWQKKYEELNYDFLNLKGDHESLIGHYDRLRADFAEEKTKNLKAKMVLLEIERDEAVSKSDTSSVMSSCDFGSDASMRTVHSEPASYSTAVRTQRPAPPIPRLVYAYPPQQGAAYAIAPPGVAYGPGASTPVAPAQRDQWNHKDLSWNHHTTLCKHGNDCTYQSCMFAHKRSEMRCIHWARGYNCTKGIDCEFLHTPDE